MKKPGSGAKEGYQPGQGDEKDLDRVEEHTSGVDENSWRAERPGAKVGDGASSADSPEPGKYKGFLERFQREIQQKSGKKKEE